MEVQDLFYNLPARYSIKLELLITLKLDFYEKTSNFNCHACLYVVRHTSTDRLHAMVSALAQAQIVRDQPV